MGERDAAVFFNKGEIDLDAEAGGVCFDPRAVAQHMNEQGDVVNHPAHYNSHPSGVECIQITEHMNFCCGNAVKYVWRHALKGGVEDLEKARWYLDREIKRLKGKVDSDV